MVVQDQEVAFENLDPLTITPLVTVVPIYTADFEYAVAQLEPLDQSDPDILGHTSDFIQNEEDAEFSCENIGAEICVIPKSSIKDPGMLTFNIRCTAGCSFRFKLELLALNKLEEKKRA